MSRRAPGQPGKLICWFRNILSGRTLEASPWLRSTKVQSTRSPDPPNLPPGINARLAANYYCGRDGRRTVQPPTVIGSYKQIAQSSDDLSSKEVAYPQITTPPTPGVGHRWTFKE